MGQNTPAAMKDVPIMVRVEEFVRDMAFALKDLLC